LRRTNAFAEYVRTKAAKIGGLRFAVGLWVLWEMKLAKVITH
jgi:hypothetical protein